MIVNEIVQKYLQIRLTFFLFFALLIANVVQKERKEELYFNCLVRPKLGVKRRVRILNKDNKGKGEAGLDSTSQETERSRSH